jgi:fermentation-respiration switch protein FrsA (DUF1100 family)
MAILVTVTGLGSVWRRRFGADPHDEKRFARAAYFNTTGVPVNGAIRARPKITGHVRFNGIGGFDPNAPLGILNGVFECAEPCVWEGQNKLLFQRRLSAPEQPDFFLVVVRASEAGHFDVGSPAWRSEGTLLISFSEWRDQQEAMLLMPASGWLRTNVGRLKLRPFICWPWSAQLYLESLNGEH